VGVGTTDFGLHRPRRGGGCGVDDEHRGVAVAVGGVLVGVDGTPAVVVGVDVGTALVVERVGVGEVLTAVGGATGRMLLAAESVVAKCRGE
jgi:hypothetical protein